jgi:hypothetical protein
MLFHGSRRSENDVSPHQPASFTFWTLLPSRPLLPPLLFPDLNYNPPEYNTCPVTITIFAEVITSMLRYKHAFSGHLLFIHMSYVTTVTARI